MLLLISRPVLPEVIVPLVAYFKPNLELIHQYLKWVFDPVLPDDSLQVPPILVLLQLILN